MQAGCQNVVKNGTECASFFAELRCVSPLGGEPTGRRQVVKRLAVAIPVLFLLLGADDRRWDDTLAITLDGRWLITEIETPLGTVVIQNEPITIVEGKMVGEHVICRLHNDRRSIDWIVADEAGTQTLAGIYRRRGDILDIYLNITKGGERPTEFVAGKARGVFRITMRRRR